MTKKENVNLVCKVSGKMYELNSSERLVLMTREHAVAINEKANSLGKRIKELEKQAEQDRLKIKKLENRLKQEKGERRAFERGVSMGSRGRPRALTKEHKEFIRGHKRDLQAFGGRHTLKALERRLVDRMGYTGGYEPIRAYVASLKAEEGC